MVKDNDDDDIMDLDAELANLDIDKDYDMMWTSFRKNLNSSSSHDMSTEKEEKEEAENKTQDKRWGITKALSEWMTEPNTVELEDIHHWKARLERDEVFSQHYRPSPSEAKELDKLGQRFQVNSVLFAATTGGSSGGGGGSGSGSETHPLVQWLSHDTPSILLKKGPILCDGQERDLILLTHGFVIAKVQQSSSSMNRFILAMSTYERCERYDDVDYVRDLWQATVVPNDNDAEEGPIFRFSVRLKSKKDLVFTCSTEQHKESWLEAWERVLLQNRSYHTQDREHRILGWQHALIQTSLWTSGVTGASFFDESHMRHKDELDTYNGLAPLHYAAIHNNVHVIERLLRDDDADKEIKDQEGRTPMYYAQRDNMQPSIIAFRQYGAKDSELLDQEEHGELTNEIRAFEKQKKEREDKQKKEREDKQKKEEQERAQGSPKRKTSLVGRATHAFTSGLSEETSPAQQHRSGVMGVQATMSEAMNALRQRGNKIDEMGNKANQMEENAAEYASLASQLKSKMKKQSQTRTMLFPWSKR